MNNFLTIKRVTLLPFEPRQVAVTGSVFVCKAATAAFVMNFDGSEDFEMDAGWTVSLDEPGFRVLMFKNTSAAALTITFYAGSSSMQYSSQSSIVISKDPATYVKSGVPTQTIGAAETITFSGADSGNARKQIVITNLENDVDLQVLDAANDVCATVLRRNAWTIDTSSLLRIYNQNGVPMGVNVLETFYV